MTDTEKPVRDPWGGLSEADFLDDLRYRAGRITSPSRANEERRRMLAIIDRLRAALAEVERHCPCGARPNSPNTHPHVIGCPVARGLGSRTVADNYNEAVR